MIEHNPEAPRTTVVICAYTERRWPELVAGARAAATQLGPTGQLLVVIDHNPALLERARSEFAGVDVLENTHTQGLSGARNTALEKVTGDVVVFLDDDAEPRAGWLAALQDPYRDPQVYAVGGWAEPVWPDGARPAHLPPELDWVVGCSYRGLPTTRGPVRNLMGCNMSFRREVFDLVGGFDESVGRVGTTPLGCEETQLCIRLRQARPDVEIVLEPAAVVDHRVSPDRVTWRYLRRRAYAEGLSKALIVDGVGRDALSSEKAYGRSVLPAALARDARAWTHGDRAAGRAVAGVPLALGSFAAGYGTALANRTRARRVTAPAPVDPVYVGQVDLADLGMPVPVPDSDLGTYRVARLLVRDGRRVLGSVDVPVSGNTVPADVVRAAVTGLPARLEVDAPAPAGTPSTAVVIATAGRPVHARRCVTSILRGTLVPDEIVLVDNAPGHADDAALLQELAAEHAAVRYVAEPRPGASRARNAGVHASTAEIVAFTDDDVLVDRWWLENLVREFGDPAVGLVTGLVAPHVLDTPAQIWFEGLGGFGKGFERRAFHRDDTTIHPLFPFTPGMVGSGNNMALRRDVWLGLGGMSTELGPGTPTRSGEDLDLFLRHVLHGGRVTYTPDALIWHEHRRDEADLIDQIRGYGTGLSAMLTRLVLDERHELVPLARRVAPGLRRLVGSSRQQAVASVAAPPKSVLRAEFAGFARGPLALRRSRRAA